MTTTWFSNTLVGLFYNKEDILEVLIQALTGKDNVKDALKGLPKKDLEKMRDKANEKCSACMIEALRKEINEVLSDFNNSTSARMTVEELYDACLAGVENDCERDFVETVVEVFREGDFLTSNWKPEDVGLYFLDLMGYYSNIVKPSRAVNKIKKLLFKATGSFDCESMEYDILSVYKLTGFLVKYGVVKKDRGSILELIIGFENYIVYSRDRDKILDSRRKAISRITKLATIEPNGIRSIDKKPQQGFDAEMVDWVIMCCRRFGFNPEFDKNVPKDKNSSSVS